MSKIARATQSIFGSSATAASIAQFGSFAAGTPLTYSGSTVTPALVQNLSNYLTGWFGAVIGNNSPMIEDMNALCYLFAYQLAYLMQAGIAEHDSETIYYTGSYCQVSGVIYVSLSDANTGNSPTTANNANWAPFTNGGLPQQVASNSSITITSGNSLTVPYMVISSGDTYTVNSGAYLVPLIFLTVNGTLSVSGTVTVI